MSSVETCIDEAVKKFEAIGYSRRSIKGVGIANQRETLILWDIVTGLPLYNAIVWTDARSQAVVHGLKARPGAAELQQTCGLALSTYPSGTKLLWMLKELPSVKKACDDGRRTVDTWLVKVYKLSLKWRSQSECPRNGSHQRIENNVYESGDAAI